jgi:hypothetical protein
LRIFTRSYDFRGLVQKMIAPAVPSLDNLHKHQQLILVSCIHRKCTPLIFGSLPGLWGEISCTGSRMHETADVEEKYRQK